MCMSSDPTNGHVAMAELEWHSSTQADSVRMQLQQCNRNIINQYILIAIYTVYTVVYGAAYGVVFGPGWRGAVQILSTVPTVDWVLLGSGKSNKGYDFGSL